MMKCKTKASGRVRHIHQYSGIAYSDIFRHIQAYPGIIHAYTEPYGTLFRTLVYLESWHFQNQTHIPPVDTGSKLNIHKMLRRRPGRLLNVLCTLNLRPVSTGSEPWYIQNPGTQNSGVFIIRDIFRILGYSERWDIQNHRQPRTLPNIYNGVLWETANDHNCFLKLKVFLQYQPFLSSSS